MPHRTWNGLRVALQSSADRIGLRAPVAQRIERVAPPPPGSLGVGLVAQVTNADYLEDLAGPFYNFGASAGFGGGVQGSGFWGTGQCDQMVLGVTFGLAITTPQAGGYGVGTRTEIRRGLGAAAAPCKSRVLR